MHTAVLYLDNIKCGGCANSIREALQDFPEIAEVSIQVDKGEVTLRSDQELQRSKYLSALTKQGYPEAGTSTLLQKGKSYVSCAIGRIKNSN